MRLRQLMSTVCSTGSMALALVALLTLSVHEGAVGHMVCPDDGERLHIERAVPMAVVDRAPANAAPSVRSHDSAHAVPDHCTVATVGAKSSVLSPPCGAPLIHGVQPAPRAPVAEACRAADVLMDAPKADPPRAA